MSNPRSEESGGAATPVIFATAIGDYINRRACGRQAKLAFDDQDIARHSIPFFGQTTAGLDIFLSAVGHAYEERWEKALLEAGAVCLTPPIRDPTRRDKGTPWADFAASLAGVAPGTLAYGREVAIQGGIGRFTVSGKMDFVVLHWDDGTPSLAIVECKASRKDRTYHRIQVATYRILVCGVLAGSPLSAAGTSIGPSGVEAGVVRIDPDRHAEQDIVAMRGMNLDFEEADVRRILAEDGPLWALYQGRLEDAEFQIDAKCDDCVFAVHCLTEAARERRLELVGATTATTRALRAAGVRTIDDLAEIDLHGRAAALFRAAPDVADTLEDLRRRAIARRKTLPGGRERAGEYAVDRRAGGPLSQLPSLAESDTPFVQVFLEVTYDHVADRVAALAAHVTASPHRLHTAFDEMPAGVDGAIRLVPDPRVREQILPRVERVIDPVSGATRATYEAEPGASGALPMRPLPSTEIIRFKSRPWSDRYDADTAAEAELIEGFFQELSDMIADVAGASRARVHLYVWDRTQIAHLVDACRRGGTGLLAHLYELLGCRQNIDQLIYSSLREEVDGRYALGWTGRGLCVVSSLSWFGRRYHWRRRVGGQEVDLDRAFRQDLFDFTMPLYHDEQGHWVSTANAEKALRAAVPVGPTILSHIFETRASFHDEIPVVYLHAYWNTLRGLQVDQRRAALYDKAAAPSHLREFYRARILALRWIENSIGEGGRNKEIEKPPLDLARLTQFRLGGTGLASAAVDFMRLEQAVALAEWISAHMTPPGDRLSLGKTIPVADVRSVGKNMVRAVIDVAHYDADRDALANICSLEIDDFVRVSPCAEEIERAQTYGQIMRGAMMGVISRLDWDAGVVEVDIIRHSETPYVLPTIGARGLDGDDLRFARATIDDNPSDLVAGRVERRLLSGRGAHAYRWFDPTDPAIPPVPIAPDAAERALVFLTTLRAPAAAGGHGLGDDQVRAALAWQDARVVLIQGPPGTGKTQTTASTILQAAHEVAPGAVILVAATTHRAIEEVLGRICLLWPEVGTAAGAAGYAPRRMEILRVYSTPPPPGTGMVRTVKASSPVTALKAATACGVAIVAGTTAALLKMAAEYDKSATGRAAGGFQAAALVVDEASMMVTPHFLALASLTGPDGRVLAAGDHHQLRSILKHDWDNEDRPPIVLYEPHESAYRTIRAIARRPDPPERTVVERGLAYTHRLHADVRALVQRVYDDDGIILAGRPGAATPSLPTLTGPDAPRAVWREGAGVYLAVHDESGSTSNNVCEARIIADMLDRAPDDAADSVAVVTPYRSQRVALRRLLVERGHFGDATSRVDIIDSVERLQGAERPVVFVSAATSDAQTLVARAAFALNLNRANVAFTRSKERLVVVCSRAVLDCIPEGYEDYQTAALWKALRQLCVRPVGRFTIGDIPVTILAPGELSIGATASTAAHPM